MNFRHSSIVTRSIPAAMLAGLCLLLAGALSIVSVNIFGQIANFAFLPLIIILLWPRRASEIGSLIVIFIAGLFADWAIGGIIGQSSLIFTIVWMIFRPEMREDPYGFLRLIFIWCLVCILASALISLAGWFVYRVSPDIMAFCLQFFIATLILPFIFVLRRWTALRFAGGDEWGQ